MMLLLDAPSPKPAAIRGFDDLDDLHEPGCWSLADAELVALSLFTVWAARTGRVLRAVPVSELTPEELEEFWADDQLEEPYAGSACRERP